MGLMEALRWSRRAGNRLQNLMATTGRITRDPASQFTVHEGAGREASIDKRTEIAIAALRARLDEEFKITERLDQKGRQLFALATVLFAVAQAVAFGAFRQSHVSSFGLVSTGIVAIIAVVALVASGHHLANAEEPRPENDIDPAYIQRWVEEQDDQEFGDMMIVHLREVAERRKASNERRVANYRRIESAARFALLITAFELAVAIAFRL